VSEFIYSINNEEFRYGSWEEALEYAWDDSVDSDIDVFTIYEGEIKTAKASNYAPGWPAEGLGEAAYDEVGDASEDWPGETKEQGADLESIIKKAVDEWADKHDLQPKFGLVKNVKTRNYRMTKASKYFDMDDFKEVV